MTETAEETVARLHDVFLEPTPPRKDDKPVILCRIAKAADAQEKRHGPDEFCVCEVCLLVREAREKGVL